MMSSFVPLINCGSIYEMGWKCLVMLPRPYFTWLIWWSSHYLSIDQSIPTVPTTNCVLSHDVLERLSSSMTAFHTKSLRLCSKKKDRLLQCLSVISCLCSIDPTIGPRADSGCSRATETGSVTHAIEPINSQLWLCYNSLISPYSSLDALFAMSRLLSLETRQFIHSPP